MFYQNIPLYIKLVHLLKKEYIIVHNLPKEYKFSLGQDIINRTWELLDLFMMAQFTYKAPEHEQKTKIIANLNLRFEELKLRLRFLSELKFISLRQVTILNSQIIEIGKMIGSWCKNV